MSLPVAVADEGHGIHVQVLPDRVPDGSIDQLTPASGFQIVRDVEIKPACEFESVSWHVGSCAA